MKLGGPFSMDFAEPMDGHYFLVIPDATSKWTEFNVMNITTIFESSIYKNKFTINILFFKM